MPHTETRVLVVEDAALVSEMIRGLLEELGYLVVGEAQNGQQAVELTQALRPDVVLMDVEMPGMDGIEATRRIQESCPTPVVVLTAYETPETLERVSAAGAGAYLVKPSNAREMERAITVALARFSDLVALRRLNAQLQAEIAERLRVEQALLRSEERYRSVTQSANDAIISTDGNGTIIAWNKGARTMFGYQEEEVSGRPLDFLMPERYRSAHQQGMARLRSTGKSHVIGATVELAGLRRDGSEFPLELSLASWQAGGETFYSAIIRDITARKEAEAALRRYAAELEQEKQKSDRLLLNILPLSVANDLKETGQTTPRIFENVTVFFSDFVGFTAIASRLEPGFLIGELNELFTAFDDIMEQNHCERIKTSGDAYLAVCGMPQPNEHHAENIVRSAIEIVEYLRGRNERSLVQWQIRIGLHSGPVVGGVVGVRKYIYDVFGDTINTAARLESHSEPMRINVSEATSRIVGDQFRFIERQAIQVRGKGEMKMYFVERRSPNDIR